MSEDLPDLPDLGAMLRAIDFSKVFAPRRVVSVDVALIAREAGALTLNPPLVSDWLLIADPVYADRMSHTLRVRQATYRGTEGWTVTGSDAIDRRLSIFTATEAGAREILAAKVADPRDDATVSAVLLAGR